MDTTSEEIEKEENLELFMKHGKLSRAEKIKEETFSDKKNFAYKRSHHQSPEARPTENPSITYVVETEEYSTIKAPVIEGSDSSYRWFAGKFREFYLKRVENNNLKISGGIILGIIGTFLLMCFLKLTTQAEEEPPYQSL